MSIELAQRFLQSTGSNHYLSSEDAAAVSAYLKEIGYLLPEERILAVDSAGEGNMNATLRVMTSRRRFILKQSRPWVAKFPDLSAPIERILIERDFHRAVLADRFLSAHMPEIYKADEKNYVLLLEDLGRAGDLSSIYASDHHLTADQLATLLEFAGKLHRLKPDSFPENRALRQLNHAHIFDLPFREDNGFPLDALYPGLAAAARPFQNDLRLRQIVKQLGEIYLSPGTCLIHGDFYPGSFLEMDGTPFVIDAEFAFLGRPEYDVGVLMAHLLLSRAPEAQILQIDSDYPKPPNFDVKLVRFFCYVEIIRRLIGIAQLPVELSLEERRSLLDRARVGLCA